MSTAEQNASQDSGKMSRGLRRRVARTLDVAATLILLATLNTFVFSQIPIKLLDPIWQLGLATAILASGSSVLISFLLIACSVGINPSDNTLIKRMKGLGRIAGIISLILFLVIPLQFFAGSAAIKARTQIILDEAQALREIVRGVQASTTEQELRSFMASLPNAPQMPAKFDSAFPVIKERTIKNLNNNISRALTDAQTTRTNSTQTFYLEFARNTIQALLLAAAYATFASLRSRRASGIGIHLLNILRLRKRLEEDS